LSLATRQVALSGVVEGGNRRRVDRKGSRTWTNCRLLMLPPIRMHAFNPRAFVLRI
jgi:hypothetical protein